MIKSFEKYLQKHPPFTSFDVKTVNKADLVVVIPVYMEDDLLNTMDSLNKCNPVNIKVAVLLIVNASVNSTNEVLKHQEKTIYQIRSYIPKNKFIEFYPIQAFNLPKKHFGAGLARKIGMDLAIHHFSETKNEDGIIVSLDADSIVAENYFDALFNFFKDKKRNACSIRFEHPLEGSGFETEIYDAIAQYELHLRYYVEALRYIGFPYAVHTIGSCFAFRASSYVSVGGMNRRQGGEEFYFIQKLLQQGGYGEVNDTVVCPSPRMSTRVPFGTGPTIKKIIEEAEKEYLTYNLQGFIDLKVLLDTVDKFYQISEEEYQKIILELPGRVRSFLLNTDFYLELKPISDNCSTLEVFKRRFYHVFNAFKLVKYINYIHEHFLEKTPVFDAAIELLELKGIDCDNIFEDRELLQVYRSNQL